MHLVAVHFYVHFPFWNTRLTFEPVEPGLGRVSAKNVISMRGVAHHDGRALVIAPRVE